MRRPIIAVFFTFLFALSSANVGAQNGRNLTPSPLVVEPGQYVYIQFNGGHIYGRFRVSNPRHDIRCFVMDEDSFENWRNGHDYRVYYESGRVSVGSMNLNLQKGTYYLIFDNGYSMLTNKVINAGIYLE